MGKVTRLARYKVTVLNLDRPTSGQSDAVLVNEGDTFYGYSHRLHREGKFFDLWFKPMKEDDVENFVTFGRIVTLVPGKGQMLYYTRLGDFLVETL